ncbi:MAG TPA: group II intron reverse transcriptase/maturase [Terriglobales bacterium]|nr:group II intron reverse transcriptase/maturase [Terriglobales bacterium]
MSDERQKIQLELTLHCADKGEAQNRSGRGVESRMVNGVTENPATECLMEEVCEAGNLRKALQRVKANRGAPGADGMTVEQLEGYFGQHEAELRQQLLSGTYQPQPVRRVEIPKADGGMRKLGIPAALDRLVQQAVAQVLEPHFEPQFSEHSFGFRPGRSAHQAIAQAQNLIASGRHWVVDFDLEKFFDRVNHDRLMARLAKTIADKRVLRLTRRFLNAGVLENGLTEATVEGTPQGSPLSPLLSNIVLDELDKELERRGHQFARYADDCNIYVASERAGQRIMASISGFITKRLKLKVNAEKSAVGRPWERKFLGFRFTAHEPPKRAIAPKAIVRFKARVRELTRRKRGVSFPTVVADLKLYLTGWGNYFGWCETPSVLRDLDGWVRRRLRCYCWSQWRHPHRRYAELRKRGVHERSPALRGSAAGPWRASSSQALHVAFPNAYFDSLGLPRLCTRKA